MAKVSGARGEPASIAWMQVVVRSRRGFVGSGLRFQSCVGVAPMLCVISENKRSEIRDAEWVGVNVKVVRFLKNPSAKIRYEDNE